VKKITQPGFNFEYTYDTRGNIISEKRNSLETTYAYDALGQLIRVNDPHENATWLYTYDRGGNILSKSKHTYTTGTPSAAIETIPYTYGDSNWKDKLTAYDGKIITYDAIGNPLNDGERTYTWGAGRQLQKVEMEGKVITFKYDHNGLRTQKKVIENGVTTTYDYTLHGKLITHLTKRVAGAVEAELHFFYDSQSRPAFVEYEGTMYRYIHNLQGDIVAIVDNTGNPVVEYKYDAWGTYLSHTGTMKDSLGFVSPFRYRGYIFDNETLMYWIRSRYYYPSQHRFIGKDTYLSVSKLPLKNNLYIYCVNTPCNTIDIDGHDAYWITASEGAQGAGHASLLVEEEDGWHYFYWGMNDDEDGRVAQVYYEKVTIDENDVLGSLQDPRNENNLNYDKTYDSAILFKGDFSKTAEFCKSIKQRIEQEPSALYYLYNINCRYNLIKYNCAIVSAYAMKRSYSVKDYYHWVFAPEKVFIIPNIAKKYLAHMTKQ